MLDLISGYTDIAHCMSFALLMTLYLFSGFVAGVTSMLIA